MSGTEPEPTAPTRRAFFRSRLIDKATSRYFDAWRGGASIVVMLVHLPSTFGTGRSPFWSVMAAGAVMAFFVLSGFFIHKSLAAALERGEPLAFVRARIDRLVPPLLFALALAAALWWLAPYVFASGSRLLAVPTNRPDFSLLPSVEFWPSLTRGFLGIAPGANGPLWSLSYEAYYYLFAFLLGLAVWTGRTGLLVASCVALLAMSLRNPNFAALGLVWVAGFLLSALHANERLPAIPAWPLALLALGLGVVAGLYPGPGSLLAFEIACGAAVALHFLAILRGQPPEVPLLPATARFSYTLYVIHFPILLFVCGITGPGVVPMLSAGAIALVLAALIGPRLEAFRPLRYRRLVGVSAA